MVDVANVPKMAIMVTSESTALEPFKAGVLPELLMKAAAHQTVLREAGSTDVFGLEGRFDSETGDWTGRLFNLWNRK